MHKSNKRYTDYDKNLILAALKVGAQNGIAQEVIAEQIAPLLCRKPSAIVSQMYILRSEWVKNIQTEMSLAYSKVKHDREEIKIIETEYAEAIEPETAAEPDEEIEPEPENWLTLVTDPVIDAPIQIPVLQAVPQPEKPPVPEDGDEIEIVINGIKEFGAFGKAVNYDISGLLHISNIANDYVVDPHDWLYIGQHINVVVSHNPNGTFSFSAKDAAESRVWQLVTN